MFSFWGKRTKQNVYENKILKWYLSLVTARDWIFVSFQHFHVEALIPNGMVFGGGDFER